MFSTLIVNPKDNHFYHSFYILLAGLFAWKGGNWTGVEFEWIVFEILKLLRWLRWQKSKTMDVTCQSLHSSRQIKRNDLSTYLDTCRQSHRYTNISNNHIWNSYFKYIVDPTHPGPATGWGRGRGGGGAAGEGGASFVLGPSVDHLQYLSQLG